MLARAALLMVQFGGRERCRRHVAQRPGGLHLDVREMMGTAIVEAEPGGRRALGAERNRDDRPHAFVGVRGRPVAYQLRREDVLDNGGIGVLHGPPAVGRFANAAETPSNERPARRRAVPAPDCVPIGGNQILRDPQHRRDHVIDTRQSEEGAGCGDDASSRLWRLSADIAVDSP